MTTPRTPHPASDLQQADSSVAADTKTVVVIAERINVTKQTVEIGRTAVTKTVSERDEIVDTVLTRDEVTVERVPVNVYVDAVPAVRIEGDTTVIPILREVAVVVKRLLVVEELRVTKRFAQDIDRQVVPLRVEHARVEHVDTATPPPALEPHTNSKER